MPRKLFLLTASLAICSVLFSQDKPNIILIMGDDMGFSDLGCYGSEVATPNLDGIAMEGVRFRQFYNMAKCAPSRASLVTGQNVGNEKAMSFAEAMNMAGYRTIMCGKQHVEDWMGEHTYVENTFNRSIWHAGNEFLIPESGKMSKPFYVNGEKRKAVDLKFTSHDIFYKPDVMTDYALKWMDEAKRDDKPIMLYMAYHTAHYPLQALPEDIAKYRDTYKVGWDVIRQKRFEKMQQLGIATEKHKLSEPLDVANPYFPNTTNPMRKNIPICMPWDELSEREKDENAFEMAVYSAMIDRMDQNIGRLIKWLKDNGEYDNTVIMYLSDNGASPYDANHDFDHPPGGAESFRSLRAGWANVANTPFKYYKKYGHEGGSNTHFIMSYPGKFKKGLITDEPGHITDIFPTLLDIAGMDYPENIEGKPTLPLQGTSLLPVAMNGEREDPAFLYSGHTKQFRSYREGDWKITRVNKGEWELYDVGSDPSEINNLAASKPDKVTQLEEAYLALEKSYDRRKENSKKKR